MVKFWTRRKATYLSRKNETNVQHEDFFEDVVTGGRKRLGHLRLSPA